MPLPLTIGVLADTHIPDRCTGLNPLIERRFRLEGVTAILHAGDVCIPAVLDELRLIAPVYAVRGNRDIYMLRDLPEKQLLEFNGVRVGISHGHGNLGEYIGDKVRKLTGRLDIGHIQRRSAMTFKDVQVNIFGHMHKPFMELINGTLFFGPGSACCPEDKNHPPTAGLLRISPDGEVSAEIFFLE
jgi:putative phosphoesterase